MEVYRATEPQIWLHYVTNNEEGYIILLLDIPYSAKGSEDGNFWPSERKYNPNCSIKGCLMKFRRSGKVILQLFLFDRKVPRVTLQRNNVSERGA